jgi:hypothetical protein
MIAELDDSFGMTFWLGLTQARLFLWLDRTRSPLGAATSFFIPGSRSACPLSLILR